jgi:hypothetical protein
MFRIDGTTMYLTRGDTLDVTVTILNEDGTEYTPTEYDAVRFAVKNSYSDQRTIIYVDIPIDTMRLRLESEDTKKFHAQKKPYVYDIQLTKEDGTVDTFIDRAQLYITEEVE